MRKRAGAGTRGATRTQREELRELMLACAKISEWLTLAELARLTGYGEASISAQLRHLRKPQYGGYVVIKRCREGSELGGRCGPLWEYRLRPQRRSRAAASFTQPILPGATDTPDAALAAQGRQTQPAGRRRTRRRTP